MAIKLITVQKSIIHLSRSVTCSSLNTHAMGMAAPMATPKMPPIKAK